MIGPSSADINGGKGSGLGVDPGADAGAYTGFDPTQLTGFRIGVTSDRRSGDLISALLRRGAEVLHAPTLKIVPADEDASLIEDTRLIIAAKPHVLLATTAYGIRGWLEAADAAGVGAELLDTLSGADILVRGPKARGAVRAGGLNDVGMSELETTASLVDQVLATGVDGKTVVVQLHGYIDNAQLERLRTAGARVLTVAPYRWTTPAEPARVGKLLDAAVSGGLDAITFTSAPAAQALLDAAAERGQSAALRTAFDNDVVAVAVGPVTAEPLTDAGVVSIYPERYRLGALIRLTCEHLAEHRAHRFKTPSGVFEIRGRQVTVGGNTVLLAPTALNLLRILVAANGAVVSKADLMTALPDTSDDHALEVAMGRLRRTLVTPGLITTVVKRGYRIEIGEQR